MHRTNVPRTRWLHLVLPVSSPKQYRRHLENWNIRTYGPRSNRTRRKDRPQPTRCTTARLAAKTSSRCSQIDVTSRRFLSANDGERYWVSALEAQKELIRFGLADPAVQEIGFLGARDTALKVKCAIGHWRMRDDNHFWCFIKSAFLAVENDLRRACSHPRSSLHVVLDVALNVFGALVRAGPYGLGVLLLDFCADFLRFLNVQRPSISFFHYLGRAVRDSGLGESLDVHMQKLLEEHAGGLRARNDRPNRQKLQAQRRQHGFLRDSGPTGPTPAAVRIVDDYHELFLRAKEELGPLHEETLKRENDFLRMQHHTGHFRSDHLQILQAAISRLEGAYASDGHVLSRAQWSRTHRAAYLKYLERKCDFYKYHQQAEEAIAVANQILVEEGYETERWIQFFLDFELWLDVQKRHQDLEHFQTQRLASKYYRDLSVEFDEAKTAVGGHLTSDPIYSIRKQRRRRVHICNNT